MATAWPAPLPGIECPTLYVIKVHELISEVKMDTRGRHYQAKKVCRRVLLANR